MRAMGREDSGSAASSPDREQAYRADRDDGAYTPTDTHVALHTPACGS